ncbi:DNA repair protein RecN [Candidatus Sumerlaeota bacterium]|nr:DNA repair protein RecN [Candidatus Sumerlaeota bacterium]
MLNKLFIQNIATIESMTISFSPGLNVLTGETGAGKSIVVGGLELALGERSSPSIIRSHQKLAASEATFIPPFPHGIDHILSSELRLEYHNDEPLVLRREISSSGRNRCFINDQMVNVGDLKRIGELLVDLHGQHEHQSLFHTNAHRNALDSFSGPQNLMDEYKTIWNETARLRRRKKELDDEARDFQKRLDYINFQIEEIERINPQPGEIGELDQEEKKLAHAESLMRSASQAYALLYESISQEQIPVLTQLGEVKKLIDDITQVDQEFSQTAIHFDDARIMLEELAFSLRDYAEKSQSDPQRLNDVVTRIDAIKRLIRKHGGSEEEMFSSLESMKSERDRMNRDDAERKEIDGKLAQSESDLQRTGQKLSEARKKAAQRFKKAVVLLLRDMAMEKSEFEIKIENLPEPGSEGLDHVEFLIAANPGLPSAPLRKVASGGELSRVMLAIKSVLAEKDAIPTLVFDEIDAGISGEVCHRVASVMEDLAKSRQILCITHHPQIAARAKSHISVQKTIRKGSAFTDLVTLDGKERLEELARMMGGTDSKAALELARQMME